MTLTVLLALVALLFTVGAAVGRLPLWPAVLMLVLIVLIAALPLT